MHMATHSWACYHFQMPLQQPNPVPKPISFTSLCRLLLRLVNCQELFAYVRASYESLLCTIVRGTLCQILNCMAKISCNRWAAWYNTWLLITLTPKGVVCSFLFSVAVSPAVCSAEAGSCGVARATSAARADSLAAASVRARLMTRM